MLSPCGKGGFLHIFSPSDWCLLTDQKLVHSHTIFRWCVGMFLDKTQLLSLFQLCFWLQLWKTSRPPLLLFLLPWLLQNKGMMHCGSAVVMRLQRISFLCKPFKLLRSVPRPGWMDRCVAIDFNFQHLRHTQRRSFGPPESRAALLSFRQSVQVM